MRSSARTGLRPTPANGDRPAAQRRPRARLGLAAAVATVLALTGCSAGQGGAAGDTDLFTAAIVQTYTTPPDPDVNYDGPGLNIIQNTYEGLVKYEDGTGTAKIVPSLASAWKVSQDGLTYTFTLRDGVTFHDGTPLTSKSVAEAVERRAQVDGGPAYMTADVTKVATPDDHTAVLTLSAPNSAFLDYLASPFGLKLISPTVLAKHAGKDHAQTWLTSHDAGTGPYELASAKTGNSYELIAYDDYWGDKPAFAAVELEISQNASAAQLELERGEIDAILGNLNKSSFESYAKSQAVTTSTFPNLTTQMVYVNPQSKAFTSAGQRERLFTGIDTKGILSAAMGSLEEPTSQLFPQGMLDSALDDQGITYEKDALAGIAASAPAKGRTVRIGYAGSSADGKAVAEELASRMNSAGLKAEAVAYAAGTIYKLTDDLSAAPDLAVFAVFPDAGHPDSWGRIIYTPKGGLDLFGAEVDGLDADLDKALTTTESSAYGPVARSVIDSRNWFSIGSLNTTLLTTPGITGTREAQNLLEYNVLHFAALGRS
ncbi:ABC transporter substrate-binding protein [Streptomyces sp. NPDC058256]|uniref:ABC transporter substrate-binding protein n=1 Tax=Streptomyces sp. NPDC058256 TaxID=3346408 RepID=UPI0036E37D25